MMLPQILESTLGVPDVVPDGDYRSVLPAYRPGTSAAAHCGALGVGFLLLTEILGIQPLGPGFREGCVLRPRIDLGATAGGVFPSPRGDIAVSWTTAGKSTTRIDVELPPGVTGRLRVPGRADELRLGEGRSSNEVATPGASAPSR